MTDAADEPIWVRQGSAVKGPFPRERVEASIQAGSLGDDMAFSLDGDLWVPGTQCRSLFPSARRPAGIAWLAILDLLHGLLCIGCAFWSWSAVETHRTILQRQWEEHPGRFGWTEASIAEQMRAYDAVIGYGWTSIGVGVLSLLVAALIVLRGRAVRAAQFAVSGIAIAFALYGAARFGVDILVIKGAALQAAVLWALLRPDTRAHHLVPELTRPPGRRAAT